MAENLNDLMNKTTAVSLADPDGIISHSDLTNVIPEVWGDRIERDAEPFRIFRQFCKVSTDLLNKPGDSVKMHKRAILNYDLFGPTTLANDLTELVPNSEISYNIVTLTPTEKGMAGSVTLAIIEESMTDVLADLLVEYANAYAQCEDLQIIEAAVATTVGEEIYYIEANSTSEVYASGKWTVAKAGTLAMTDCGLVRHGDAIKQLKWSATQTNITSDDVMDVGVIVRAKQVVMPSHGFQPDVLVMHPKPIGDLMVNPQFLDASKSGTNSVLMTGQLMNFMGLKIFQSENLPILACAADGNTVGYQAIMLDSRKALGMAIKRLLMIDTEWKPSFRKWNLYFTWKNDVKRLNDDAIMVINTA
jgi:hypothetical protein